MKHTPTSEELERAVIGVLQQSEKELTAKEVREKLLKDNGGWKVPAERRIAKFVKRQNSRKANKNKSDDNGRNGVIGRFFKNDGKGKSPTLDKQPPESHPRNATADDDISVSDKERKGGFRRIFSPHSPKKRMTSSQTVPVPESPSNETEDGSVTTPDTVEADTPAPEVDTPVPEATEVEVVADNPPVVAATEAEACNPPSTESAEEQADIDRPPSSTTIDVVPENDSAANLEATEPQTLPDKATDVKLSEEVAPFEVLTAETTENVAVQEADEIVVEDVTAEIVDQVPRGVMDAYVDDNDGKKNDCDCGACAIM